MRLCSSGRLMGSNAETIVARSDRSRIQNDAIRLTYGTPSLASGVCFFTGSFLSGVRRARTPSVCYTLGATLFEPSHHGLSTEQFGIKPNVFVTRSINQQPISRWKIGVFDEIWRVLRQVLDMER